jgi:hypothetical protein
MSTRHEVLTGNYVHYDTEENVALNCSSIIRSSWLCPGRPIYEGIGVLSDSLGRLDSSICFWPGCNMR